MEPLYTVNGVMHNNINPCGEIQLPGYEYAGGDTLFDYAKRFLSDETLEQYGWNDMEGGPNALANKPEETLTSFEFFRCFTHGNGSARAQVLVNLKEHKAAYACAVNEFWDKQLDMLREMFGNGYDDEVVVNRINLVWGITKGERNYE